MKFILPILGAAALAASCVWLVAQEREPGQGRAPQTAPVKAEFNPTSTEAAISPSRQYHNASGQDLIRESLAQLLAQPSLSVHLRQRIEMFGHHLIGTGGYQQLGTGQGMQLRMSMAISGGTKGSSIQQRSNGRFLWIYRDLNGTTQLGRVDLRRVREAMANHPHASLPAGLTISGLPRLLESLDENFSFSTVQQANFGELPVLILQGTWKGPTEESRSTPKGDATVLPSRVQVAIGRDDYLPRQIIFLRDRESEQAKLDSPAKPQALLTLEMLNYEIGQEIDPFQFGYEAGEQAIADLTPQYIASLRRPDRKVTDGQ